MSNIQIFFQKEDSNVVSILELKLDIDWIDKIKDKLTLNQN
jgi:hypothetical protein